MITFTQSKIVFSKSYDSIMILNIVHYDWLFFVIKVWMKKNRLIWSNEIGLIIYDEKSK